MTTGPLPQLSDLFIKEAASPRADRSGSASLTADAEVFERFLRTAGPEQLPGPTPTPTSSTVRSADRPGPHAGRRDPIDRDRRPAPGDDDRRAAAERRDGPGGDRRVDASRDRDGIDRSDRSDNRSDKRVDDSRPDDRVTDDRDDARPIDDTDEARAEEAVTDETGTGEDGPDGDATAASDEPQAGDEAGDVPTVAELPTGAEAALLTPAVETDRIDVPTDATDVDLAIEDETVDGIGGLEAGAEEAPVELDDQLEGDDADLVDPTSAAAAGAAALAAAGITIDNPLAGGTGADEAEGQSTEIVAGDGSLDSVTAVDESATADDSASVGDGSVDTPLDAVDPGAEQVDEVTVEDTQADPTAVPGDGGSDAEVVAPLTGAVSSTSGSAERSGANPTTVSGVENVSTVTARRGPAPTTASAAATGPVVDGEPGEPLWLQVHRAVGSLRTLRNGEQQVTIRLRPQELGSVMVRINAGERGTSVSLVAESAIAASQLGQQRQQLVDQLERGGLHGVAVDIGTGANPDQTQAGADSHGDTGSANGSGSGPAGPTASGGPGDGPVAFRGRRGRGSSVGLVDLDL